MTPAAIHRPLAQKSCLTVPFAAIRPRGFMTNKNGGPAFPVAGSEHNYPIEGMTLRDYFAAKAMQAMLSNQEWNHWSGKQHAEYAYGVADEMLQAREAS